LSGTRERGATIEAAALAHLLRAGLREVAANANYRHGELDLVMLDRGGHDRGGRDGDVLVFVEVRYRRSSGFGGGAVSIDAGKQHRLVRAAHSFLATHREYARCACRFDVIDASGDPDAPVLNWLKDAFRADDA
jgi:putative endonuclease